MFLKIYQKIKDIDWNFWGIVIFLIFMFFICQGNLDTSF